MTKPVDTDPVAQRVRALVKDSPDLKDAAELYGSVIPLLRDADPDVAPVSLTVEDARRKMKAGLPLLHGLDLELDAEKIRGLIIKLAASVENIGGKGRWHGVRLPWLRASARPDAAARLRLALEEDRLDVIALLPHITAGESGPVTAAAQGLQLDPDLLWTLAQNALKPALRAWCRQLTPMVKGVPWQEGRCFICGAVPALGELQGNNQARHLRCGQCGADWAFPRLRCTYCGKEDRDTLIYLYPEKQRERMSIEVCQKCNGYLKIIAAFTPTPPEMLQIEDLATLHLDYVAQERGYTRPLRKTLSRS